MKKLVLGMLIGAAFTPLIAQQYAEETPATEIPTEFVTRLEECGEDNICQLRAVGDYPHTVANVYAILSINRDENAAISDENWETVCRYFKMLCNALAVEPFDAAAKERSMVLFEAFREICATHRGAGNFLIEITFGLRDGGQDRVVGLQQENGLLFALNARRSTAENVQWNEFVKAVINQLHDFASENSQSMEELFAIALKVAEAAE